MSRTSETELGFEICEGDGGFLSAVDASEDFRGLGDIHLFLDALEQRKVFNGHDTGHDLAVREQFDSMAAAHHLPDQLGEPGRCLFDRELGIGEVAQRRFHQAIVNQVGRTIVRMSVLGGALC